MADSKKILKISNLNFSDDLKNFNLEIDYSPKSINSIICFDNSSSSLLKILGKVEENFECEALIQDAKKIIYMPTKSASFPWLNVKENIKFVIENSNFNCNLTDEEIKKIIYDVGLGGYDEHFPNNKSVGFRFRISLANVLALGADLILIDNSFNLMNSETKFEIYDLLKSITSQYNNSVLISTNKITEAIYLSENIFLMKAGSSKIIDNINLKDEWVKLDTAERRNRKQILKEKIINSFLNDDVNCIL